MSQYLQVPVNHLWSSRTAYLRGVVTSDVAQNVKCKFVTEGGTMQVWVNGQFVKQNDSALTDSANVDLIAGENSVAVVGTDLSPVPNGIGMKLVVCFMKDSIDSSWGFPMDMPVVLGSTDTSWRCAVTEQAGWTGAAFDHSAWFPVSLEGMAQKPGLPGPTSRKKAYWIWTPRKVYFRADLTSEDLP